jgi:hypothetical protein
LARDKVVLDDRLGAQHRAESGHRHVQERADDEQLSRSEQRILVLAARRVTRLAGDGEFPWADYRSVEAAHESPRPGGSSLPPAWLLIIFRYISLVTPATGTSLMQPKPGMRHARPQ